MKNEFTMRVEFPTEEIGKLWKRAEDAAFELHECYVEMLKLSPIKLKEKEADSGNCQLPEQEGEVQSST